MFGSDPWDEVGAAFTYGSTGATALRTPVELIAEGLEPAAARAWRWTARDDQLPPEGPDWLYWILCAGRGFGKALDCGTMIPTPSGWRKLGELAVGDEVFDESGRPCTITGVYEPTVTEAYRLTFSDGTTLDACADHQWVTWTRAERKAYLRSRHETDRSRFPAEWPAWRAQHRDRWGNMTTTGLGPQIRTTREIVDTLTYGSRGDTNHCIPTTGPVELPDVELPIDPWLLGMWLGDGHSGSANLTAHRDDVPHVLAELERAGYSPTVYTTTNTARRIAVHGGLRLTLRALGVLGDKHVPEFYLWASVDQREALLRGLMDSDGYVGTNQHVEFCSTTRALAEAVAQLATSLGQKPVLSEGRARLAGVDHGPKYRVTWRPTRQPFGLTRKASRVDVGGGAQSLRNHHRMIVSAEEIAPAAMRCLTVDGPHHTYLAGEAMIPTHNSYTGSNVLAEWAVNDVGDYAAIGPTFGDTRKIMTEGPSGLLVALGDDLESYNKADYILYLRNGSRIILASADAPDRARGLNLRGVWMDELAAMRDSRTLWDEALLPALRIGARPRAVITTTPRRGSPVLAELLERAEKGDPTVHVTRGRTMDNADNLSDAFLRAMYARYGGTSIGEQELEGLLLKDAEGALITSELLAATRIGFDDVPDLSRITVGVDPAVTSGPTSDHTGITVLGLGAAPAKWKPPGGNMYAAGQPHLYVLQDRSVRTTPTGWAHRALTTAEQWAAETIVAEVNNGGDLVGTTVRMVATEQGLPVPTIRQVRAARGKRARAEPLVPMFEQGRVHMVGRHELLEGEWTSWVPHETSVSPDRLDSMVWAAVDLMPSLAVKPGTEVRVLAAGGGAMR